MVAGCLFTPPGRAQELEPRALTNLPRGINFVILGYIYSSGNTLLDPSIPLEDYDGQINSLVLAYVRSINFFGKSGKMDAILPIAGGDFGGVFEGEDFGDSYTGLGDLRLRATINLTGAPSLEPEDFRSYAQGTVTGLGVQVIIPTGTYKKEQLPNLGSNRWSMRILYGVSHSFDKWIIEGFSGVWLFWKNEDFLGDNLYEQAPLWILKGNLVRSFHKPEMWLAFSLGYGYGARPSVNGNETDAIISQLRLGLTFALPLHTRHTLKFVAGSGIRFQEGGDFDLIGVSYTFKWPDGKRRDQLAHPPSR